MTDNDGGQDLSRDTHTETLRNADEVLAIAEEDIKKGRDRLQNIIEEYEALQREVDHK